MPRRPKWASRFNPRSWRSAAASYTDSVRQMLGVSIRVLGGVRPHRGGQYAHSSGLQFQSASLAECGRIPAADRTGICRQVSIRVLGGVRPHQDGTPERSFGEGFNPRPWRSAAASRRHRPAEAVGFNPRPWRSAAASGLALSGCLGKNMRFNPRPWRSAAASRHGDDYHGYHGFQSASLAECGRICGGQTTGRLPQFQSASLAECGRITNPNDSDAGNVFQSASLAECGRIKWWHLTLILNEFQSASLAECGRIPRSAGATISPTFQSASLAECGRILPIRMVLCKCKNFMLTPKGGAFGQSPSPNFSSPVSYFRIFSTIFQYDNRNSIG